MRATSKPAQLIGDHGLWFVPTSCVAAALAVAAGTLALDRGPLSGAVPQSWTGSATAAQSILSTAASSMLSLVTIVLTVGRRPRSCSRLDGDMAMGHRL